MKQNLPLILAIVLFFLTTAILFLSFTSGFYNSSERFIIMIIFVVLGYWASYMNFVDYKASIITKYYKEGYKDGQESPLHF